jgi:hypothetical protein
MPSECDLKWPALRLVISSLDCRSDHIWSDDHIRLAAREPPRVRVPAGGDGRRGSCRVLNNVHESLYVDVNVLFRGS